MVISRSIDVVKFEHERPPEPLRESALRAAIDKQAAANKPPFEARDVAIAAALDQDFGEFMTRTANPFGSTRPSLPTKVRRIEPILLNQPVDSPIV